MKSVKVFVINSSSFLCKLQNVWRVNDQTLEFKCMFISQMVSIVFDASSHTHCIASSRAILIKIFSHFYVQRNFFFLLSINPLSTFLYPPHFSMLFTSLINCLFYREMFTCNIEYPDA